MISKVNINAIDKVTTITDQSLHTEIPSAKAVYDSLKTINGVSVIKSNESENIVIKTNQDFESEGFITNSTVEAFCESVANNQTAIPGMSYLGLVKFKKTAGSTGTGFPEGTSMSQAEIIAQVISLGGGNKVIFL